MYLKPLDLQDVEAAFQDAIRNWYGTQISRVDLCWRP